MKTHCPKGHPYKRDEKGHARCAACDRERYRARHPYNKAQRLSIVTHLAPRLRSQSKKSLHRRLHVVDKNGVVTGHTTVGKLQESLLEKHDMAFEVGDGVRPKQVACTNCLKPFEANTQGVVAAVCLDGCDRTCRGCQKKVSLQTAREAAKQGRRPACRRCADLNRPKATRCKRGHAFTLENTLFSEKTNQRFCRTCKRERMRAVRERKKKAA